MHRAARAGLVAAILGAAVWAVSPWVSGHKEPWDAEGFFYIASLALGGLVSGLLIPKPLWAHYLGSVLGQLLYEVLFLKIGPLLFVGVIFLFLYSLVFLGGAFIGSRVRL